jgi:hypothetical protein
MKKKIIYFGLFIFLNSVFGCAEQVFEQDHNPVQEDHHLKSATSKTYYVSPSGDDTNDGLSMATPWKTIARSLSDFEINMIIIIFRS